MKTGTEELLARLKEILSRLPVDDVVRECEVAKRCAGTVILSFPEDSIGDDVQVLKTFGEHVGTVMDLLYFRFSPEILLRILKDGEGGE